VNIVIICFYSSRKGLKYRLFSFSEYTRVKKTLNLGRFVTIPYFCRYMYMRNFKPYLIGLLFFGALELLSAQTNSAERIGIIEAELAATLLELRAARNDNQIAKLNNSFISQLEGVIEEEWFFDHPFSALQTIGKIYSEDKEVRLITWNVEWENHSHTYHGYILKREKRKEGHFVVKLEDKSKLLPRQTKEILSTDNWYGALYYDIKDVEKGKKTYYTLLGYDYNNDRSTIKLLDVLHFAGKNAKFGYPFFETKEGFENRVYFEYSSRAVMSLKYERDRNMIIFDHLSPESPGLAEFREYYIPDMSYDAYKFEDFKWRLKEDIIALNKKESEVVELKAYDKDLDTVVSIRVKKEWNNPEDPNAPIDGGGHRAVLPDETENKEPKTAKDKTAKDKDPGFTGVSYSNLNEKKKKKRKKKK
jgi:hypothetical protein